MLLQTHMLLVFLWNTKGNFFFEQPKKAPKDYKSTIKVLQMHYIQ